MNRSLAAALGLLAAVCLPACDDDTADDGDRDAALAADADQDWDAATDAGGADEESGGCESGGRDVRCAGRTEYTGSVVYVADVAPSMLT